MGFEPTDLVQPGLQLSKLLQSTALPHFRSRRFFFRKMLNDAKIIFEEVVGFEPTDRVSSIYGLANRCNRPLCHTSNIAFMNMIITCSFHLYIIFLIFSRSISLYILIEIRLIWPTLIIFPIFFFTFSTL